MRKNVQLNAFVLLFTTAWPTCWTLDNGLVLTPPMGFKTPLDMRCNTEQYVKELADEMVNQGYKQLGYEYLIITNPIVFAKRYENNALVYRNFPSGMKKLADYVHSKGLKIGLSLDVFFLNSQNENGQAEYLPEDMKKHVQTLASWGIDYVQLTNEFADKVDKTFNAMTNETYYWHFQNLLNETGNSIVFDCAWIHHLSKRSEPVDYKTITDHCNLYSTFYSVYFLPEDDIIRHVGPGHWAYSYGEYIKDALFYDYEAKWLMAMKAIFALPLMYNIYSQNLTSESKAFLQNKEIIQVNQDPLRIPGRVAIKGCMVNVAVRPITPVIEGQHSFALGFFYDGFQSRPVVTYRVSLDKLQLNNTNGYIFTDLFSPSTDNRTTFTSLPGSNITVTISQSVALLKATPIPSKFGAPKK